VPHLWDGMDHQKPSPARFFRAQLRRRGEQDLQPDLLRFYDALAEDPQRALSDVSFDAEGGAGRALAA
jgi:hypothetical protein